MGSLSFRKVLNIIWKAAAAVLVSVYLSFIVVSQARGTELQQVFVFVYFLLMCGVLIWLVRKLSRGHELPKYVTAVLLLFALECTLMGSNALLPKKLENTISIQAVPRADGSYGEIWLTAAMLDGQEVSISDLEMTGSLGWSYSGDYDDYVFYPAGEQDGANKLSFDLYAAEVTLTFAQNSWSGVAEVQLGGEPSVALDLSGSDRSADDSDSLTYTLNAQATYTLWERTLYCAGACVLIAFALYVAVLAWNCRSKGKQMWSIKQVALATVLLANACLLFLTDDRIITTRVTKLFLLLLTGLSVLCINGDGCREKMKKYATRGCGIWLLVITVYASLASFGQRFFLDGDTRMHFSLSGLLYCVSGVLWFLSILWMLLFCMEYLSSRERKSNASIGRRWAWWSIFIPLLICQGVIWVILCPGGFPVDSINQIGQALGYSPLDDSHPVLHTLIERAILAVIPAAGAITAVQMLLFTWLLTAILMLGFDRGVSRFPLVVMGCVFQLLPNQALSWSNALKDFPFTLALLWGLYLLALLALNYDWCKKWTYYVCLALDVFLILGLRHNGIVPAICMAVLAAVLTIRDYSRFKMRLAAAMLAGLTLFGVYKGPVFDVLDVRPSAQSPYTTMLCAVASCINKELPLSDETMETMEKVIPAEDWAQYYARYYGHDIYCWYRPEGSKPYDLSTITTKDVFSAYFDALLRYPDVVIKDRLDGSDIMWDVAQPQDSFNARSFSFISPFSEPLPFNTENMVQAEDGSFYKDTKFTNLYFATMNISIGSVLDVVLWRSGAYLIAFFVLALFWWKNRMGRMFWASVPMLGNVAALALALYHQSFRYVYFIQVSVVALLFLSILEAGRKETELK